MRVVGMDFFKLPLFVEQYL